MGRNNETGTIIESHATGNARATLGVIYVGGLVGENKGTIRASHATGDVIMEAGVRAGGLVGRNSGSGTISGCYATGVTIGGHAGGLVGENNGTIRASHCNGGCRRNRSWQFRRSGGVERERWRLYKCVLCHGECNRK